MIRTAFYTPLRAPGDALWRFAIQDTPAARREARGQRLTLGEGPAYRGGATSARASRLAPRASRHAGRHERPHLLRMPMAIPPRGMAFL